MTQTLLGRNDLPSQEELRNIFNYIYGNLYWKVKFSRKVNIGGRAGGPLRNGYWGVRLGGTRYFLHRLIWQWHHGDCPFEIDHIDGDPSNNKIENLRAVPHQVNMCNRKAKGVYETGRGTYVSQFRHKHLGIFDTFEAATEAYKKARDTYIEEVQLDFNFLPNPNQKSLGL